MAWNFWRTSSSAAAADNADAQGAGAKRNATDVDKMRTTARRRLIGATVLVGLTVLIFPWVFKQQPRPLSDDLVIEVPRKDAAKPMAQPSNTAAPSNTAPPSNTATPATTAQPVANNPSANNSTASSNPAASASLPTAAPVVSAVAVTAAAASTKPDPKPAAKEESKKPAAAAEAKPTPATPVTTAPAAVPAATATGSRYVVQVAAFADANKAREVRIKLEAQGYKTYSQAIDSPKGKVWRVRVGPFDNKAEAEKAQAQIKGIGYTPALLEL